VFVQEGPCHMVKDAVTECGFQPYCLAGHGAMCSFSISHMKTTRHREAGNWAQIVR
jgi:hypothetical protein